MITRRRLLAVGGGGATLALASGFLGKSAGAGLWRPMNVGETLRLNGNDYEVECGSNPIALQVSKQQVLRFSMLHGNGWEKDDPNGSERTELDGWRHRYPAEVPLWASYSFHYERGPWSTSDWCMLRQVYPWSGLVLKPGGRLHWLGPAEDTPAGQWPAHTEMTLEQGRWYHVVERFRLDPAGGKGYWQAWLDGRQIVDIAGALGSTRAKSYWLKLGIYRGKWTRQRKPASETVTVRYVNPRFGKSSLEALIAKPDPVPEWEPWPA